MSSGPANYSLKLTKLCIFFITCHIHEGDFIIYTFFRFCIFIAQFFEEFHGRLSTYDKSNNSDQECSHGKFFVVDNARPLIYILGTFATFAKKVF